MTYAAALIISILAHCNRVAPDPNAYSDCEFDAMLIARIQLDKSPKRVVYRLEALEFACRCPHGHYDRKRDVDVCE